MAELTERLVASGAETLVLISPHAPLDAAAFVAYQAPFLRGDFSKFRARETKVEVPFDQEMLRAISLEARSLDYEIINLGPHELDHGSTVPLYFLLRNGWQGNVVALGYSFLSVDDHLRFGACINRAAARMGKPTAVLASGDLSHRLKPGAPAGFNPEAHLFDEEVVSALDDNSPERIVRIDPELRKRAGECGYRSMLIAIGATREAKVNCEVLNYEAPFGVGYLVAQLTNVNAPAESQFNLEVELPRLARTAVETFVKEGKQLTPASMSAGLLASRAACFVSIKTLDGSLRGCIGTIEPQRDSLAEEIVVNAISAATHDPRFSPVTAGELKGLKYSVDILSAAEPATLDDLDPIQYGVIVEEERGDRRGLLLPDIPGIDTVAKQVEIATRKAGIRAGKAVKLLRFRVDRFREKTGL
jgi:AmmeMemoRadiSam system protein A